MNLFKFYLFNFYPMQTVAIYLIQIYSFFLSKLKVILIMSFMQQALASEEQEFLFYLLKFLLFYSFYLFKLVIIRQESFERQLLEELEILFFLKNQLNLLIYSFYLSRLKVI